MARPVKQEAEKRSETARFRVTLAEREHISSQAAIAGLTETEYMRHRTLGLPLSPPRSLKFDPAIVHELNRIGNNVNQLARSVHRGSDFSQYWQEIGTQLITVLSMMLSKGDEK